MSQHPHDVTILIIDNYDSFVHNLARLFRLAGAETQIIRNDCHQVGDVLDMAPQGIVLSPGPATPQKSGICIDLVKSVPTVPVLGICLGHQVIGEAYGGTTERAVTPLHGQASEIHHDGCGILSGLPSPLGVGRYHSLVTIFIQNTDISIQSRSAEGDIMALMHRYHPHFGIQWHPESILTEGGEQLISNFMTLCRERAHDMA